MMTMYKKLVFVLLTALAAALGGLIAAYFFTRKPVEFSFDDEDALFV